jgi:hypothetical protein
LVFKAPSNRGFIENSIGLGTGCTHGWTLARVEGAELDACFVGTQGHGTAERIELADKMAFADSPDGRVARHLSERFDVVREQEGLCACACGGKSGLSAGMSTTNDKYIKLCREIHAEEQVMRR